MSPRILPRMVRRTMVDLLDWLDRRNPTGFFSQDSGTWAYSVWSWLVSPKKNLWAPYADRYGVCHCCGENLHPSCKECYHNPKGDCYC